MTTRADFDIAAFCRSLQPLLIAAKDDTGRLYQAIVDTPFVFRVEATRLFLGFLTFYLVDEAKQLVYLAAATENEYYHHSIDGYKFNPKRYKVSLRHEENSIVQAIQSGQPVSTDNWDTLRRPRIEAGIARINQASGGIGYSVVVPFQLPLRGALMYNYFQEHGALDTQHEAFMKRYTKLVEQVLQ